jgi:type IV secretion system protein VirB11
MLMQDGERGLPQQAVQERVMAMLTTALGPVGAFLEDETVIEIMVNPDGRVWVERLGEAPRVCGDTLDAVTVERILRLVASSMGVECHAEAPSLSAILPGSGARFQGFVPPVVARPVFVIRKKALHVFTLEDYVRSAIMTAQEAEVITRAVRGKRNILIAGGTGSGKTTLANAILAVMAATGDRLVTIEDTPELQCTAPNHLALYTREGVASMRHLVKDTMRCRPDRIIVGEVRDGAALDLLKSWTTGHPGGLCTIHAHSPQQALLRLEQLLQEVVVEVPRGLITDVVHLIVCIGRTPTGRRVLGLAEMVGFAHGEYMLNGGEAAGGTVCRQQSTSWHRQPVSS